MPKNKSERRWHLIDVHGKVLGRVSVEIAHLLMGKGKPEFIRNLDSGDYVVVTNAKEVAATGQKEEKKFYYRHSGFPGGFKKESLGELRQRRPEEVVRHAVAGMLPQNKLKDKFLARLFIFGGQAHTYKDKFMKEES